MTQSLPPTVLGTCCVPWREDGSFDELLFRKSIRSLHARGMQDLYIFGTAGEGHAVCEARYREVATVFVEETRALGAQPMVGVISLSLATALERIDFARGLGVTLLQVSLPNWGAVRDSEVRAFFRETCDSFPDVNFLHYNLARAGRIVRPDEYAELSEHHPNLVATKYGAGEPEVVAGLMVRVPTLTHFFTELGYFQAAPLGRCGLLSSVSSSNPARAREYFTAGATGNWERLAELYGELAGVMLAIRECVGAGRIDGAYDKAIAKIVEPTFPLRLLAPYEAATEMDFERYRRRLAESFPEWLPEGAAEQSTTGAAATR